MATLYELSAQAKRLLDLLESGEIDEEVYQDTISAMNLEEDLEDKIDDYIYVIDEIDAQAKRIKDEEKRLADRRRSVEKNSKRMKDTLTETMIDIKQPKTTTLLHTVWTQNNPPRLIVHDETNIPKKFYIERAPELDRRKLLDYLKKTGETIDGVEVEQTKGVRYR